MPIKKHALIVPGNVDLSKVRVTEFQKRYPDQLNRYIRILEENPDDHLGILLLKPSSDGYFEILDGHHRYLAYVMMGRAVAFANIIEERYIHDPRWNDPGFVQGIRDELAAQAGIDANAPDRSDLRAQEERGRAAVLGIYDVYMDLDKAQARIDVDRAWPELTNKIMALVNEVEDQNNNQE